MVGIGQQRKMMAKKKITKKGTIKTPRPTAAKSARGQPAYQPLKGTVSREGNQVCFFSRETRKKKRHNTLTHKHTRKILRREKKQFANNKKKTTCSLSN